MALDFPNSPTAGQSYTGTTGAEWIWDGAKWGSTTGTDGPFLPLSGGTLNAHLTGTTSNQVLNVISRAVGSGVNGPATAQLGVNIDLQKDNWYPGTGPVADGEIDGLYIHVRNGGTGDGGAILCEVGGSNIGFSSATEMVCERIDHVTGALLARMDMQEISINNGGGPLDCYGMTISAMAGTMTTGLNLQSGDDTGGVNPGHWTNFIRCSQQGAVLFNLDGAGNLGTQGSITVNSAANGFLTVQGHRLAGAAFPPGASLMWNVDGGSAQTWLVNQKGGGPGGFIFGEADTTGTITNRMVIDQNGLATFYNGILSLNYMLSQGATAATAAAGAYLMWSKAGGDGGTWLLNQKGGGAGGFHLGEVTTAGVVTDRLAIDASGIVTVSGAIKLSGAVVVGAPAIVATAAYTVSATDYTLIMAAGGTMTVTLPAPVLGRILILRNGVAFAVNSASANVYPFSGAALGAAIMPAGPAKFCWLQCDGTNWQTMMAN